jgi:nucleoside phosphorylase
MLRPRTHSRRVSIRPLLVAALVAGVLGAPAVSAKPKPKPKPAQPACVHRVLILGAMPLELNPLVAAAKLDPAATVHVNDRTFYVGQLAGSDVVLALSGIGPVNAGTVTKLAMDHFRCSFSAVLFSGVAGSSSNIGDVWVPETWTLDGGKHYYPADRKMLATSRALAGSSKVKMWQDLPVGDAACLCGGVDAPTPVHLPNKPVVRIGGVGSTGDVFSGKAAPCMWGGGDIAGCAPCLMTGDLARDTANFLGNSHNITDPTFFTGLFAAGGGGASKGPKPVVGDMETAAVAEVAAHYKVPFLGFRAVSDGAGDPLHLPGFPVQFAVYRQLAGNNAAAVTIAYLKVWKAKGRPGARRD